MKAILVLDEMPKGCINCHALDRRENFCCSLHRDKPITLPVYNNRQPFCSLKPMPKYVDTDNYSDAYGFGWNDCVDEILREEE